MLYDEKSSGPEPEEEEEPERKSMIFRLWENTLGKMKKHEESDEELDERDGPGNRRDLPDEPRTEERPPPPKPDLASMIGEKNNYLEALRRDASLQSLGGTSPGRYPDFMLDESIPSKEQKSFLRDMQQSAKFLVELKEKLKEKLETELKESQDADKPKEAAKAAELVGSVDASVQVKLPPDRMQAWLFAFPPVNGGKHLTEEDVKKAMQRVGVKYGVDDELLSKIVKGRHYLQLAVVATGKPPVDGQDGTIEELFPRSYKVNIQEKDDNTVDYKNLNWLHPVQAGGIICHIHPPTQAEAGMRVTGEETSPRLGREAVVPKGKGTVVNEEHTALVAEMDGEVTFAENKFKVDQLLLIKGDVDNSTGNLDFLGNIIINGDVRTGFTVKAVGHITIKGMAEGAWIIAGGNIQVGMGMNGSGRGVIDSGGDVSSKYLENCTVSAGGSVYSDSIVNCTVYSNDNVQITSGYGVIIGGSVTALNKISAHVVGNQSNRPTVLVLGNTPSMIKEKADLEQALKRLDTEMEETAKGINYLQTGKFSTLDQQKMLSELKLKSPILRLQKSKTERRLKEIEQLSADFSKCRVCCDTLYPPTQLNFGCTALMVQRPEHNCNVFYSSGEIHIGTK